MKTGERGDQVVSAGGIRADEAGSFRARGFRR